MIALSDGVSNPLQKMADNANNACRRMENLGKAAMGVESKVAGINVAAAVLDRVSMAASGAVIQIESIAPAVASTRDAKGAIEKRVPNILSCMITSL